MIFKDGDSVKMYANKTDKGYYKVAYIENFTRSFVKANSYFDNPPKNTFGAVTKGIAYGASFSIMTTIIVALLSHFADFSNNSSKIVWIVVTILCVLFGIWISIAEMKEYIADFKK